MSSSATIDKAVKERWRVRGLEQWFKRFWADPAIGGFHAFNDTEARANTPMPYCIYEKSAGVLLGRSTGSGDEPIDEIEYWQIPVQFTIVAATPSTGLHRGRSGKDIAAELLGNGAPDATGLLGAFEDAAGLFEMDGRDCHVQTLVGADYHVRDDDDVWNWVLPLDIQITRRRRLRQSA